MNWKKIFTSVILAPLGLSLGYWANNNLGGTHIPFTFATVGIPAVTVALKGLIDLFQNPPHK